MLLLDMKKNLITILWRLLYKSKWKNHSHTVPSEMQSHTEMKTLVLVFLQSSGRDNIKDLFPIIPLLAFLSGYPGICHKIKSALQGGLATGQHLEVPVIVVFLLLPL